MGVSSLECGFSEIAVVGGGIARATLARVLARAGLAVTVLEQQPSNRDRVRGEYLQPWGVAEAQQLDASEIPVQAGGFFIRRIIPYDEINSPHAAADEEDAVEKFPVTPVPIVPAREQSGCLLLEQNRPGLASKEFATALANAPGRRPRRRTFPQDKELPDYA